MVLDKKRKEGRMKKIIFIVVGTFIALVIISVIKDMVIKISVEKGVEFVTGLPLSTKGFNVGIARTVVNIRGLELFNPKSFKDRMMLDMPEIYVDYDLPAIIGGKVHLRNVRLDMKEFDVVKDEKGNLNLNSLKVVQAEKQGAKPEGKGGKAPSIKIDSLRLKIGKVLYKDYSSGSPSVKEFNINLDETYTNIDNPYALVSLIVVKALMNTTIAGLANFDVSGLKGTVSDTLATAQKNAEEAVSKVKETAQKASGEAAKQAQDAIKKTTESLGGAFKMFGSDKK